MSAIPQGGEINTHTQQNSIYLDFVKKEFYGKPAVKDEPILEECLSAEFHHETESEEVSDNLIDGSGKICSREDLLKVNNRVSAIPAVAEVITLSEQKLLSLDFVTQDFDEKPKVKDEIIFDECTLEESQNVTEESKDITQQLMEENGKILTREDFPLYCNVHSIKPEENVDFVADNESKDTFSKLEAKNEQNTERCDCNTETLLQENMKLRSSEYRLLVDKNNDKLRAGCLQSTNLKPKNHKCDLCDYSATLKANLQQHLNSVHFKIKNHKCHLCDYSASKKYRLQVHIQSVHLKVKNHKCHLCEYRATLKKNLNIHIASVHLNIKNHECQFCDYSTYHKSRINYHINSVHLKLKNHICHFCDYRASLKTTLRDHIDSVHLQVRNHKCHFCDYSSSLKNTLRDHIDSIHLQMKSHKCKFCDYSTNLKRSLKNHLNCVHLNTKTHN